MRASLLANNVKVFRWDMLRPYLHNHTYFRISVEFGVSCVYGCKAFGMTFTGESFFNLNESSASCPKLPSTTKNDVAKDATNLLDCQQPGLSSTIVAHCNGVPSPPESEGEEFGYNSRLGIAALEVMSRFNQRTVLSVGTTQAAAIYQKEVFSLACSVSNSKRLSVQKGNLTVFSIHS